jgi:hypothetical protein
MKTDNSDRLDSTRIRGLVERWRQNDIRNRINRERIWNHYNGAPIITPEGMGARFENLLTGHKWINRSFEQLSSLYDSPMGMFRVWLDTKEQGLTRKQQFIGQCMTEALNKTIVQSRRFERPYRTICGDVNLFGASAFYGIADNDWLPSYGPIYYSTTAPQDCRSGKFLEWAASGDLSADFLMRKLRAIEKYDREDDSTWDRKNLRGLLDAILLRHSDKEKATIANPDLIDAEFRGRDFELNWPVDFDARNTTVPVYWYFTKNYDTNETDPFVSLYCVHRFAENENISGLDGNGPPKLKIEYGEEGKKTGDAVLYYQRSRYSEIDECFWPILLDCMIGTPDQREPLMSDVLGLGKINYALDWRIQMLIHSGMMRLDYDNAVLMTHDGTVSDFEVDAWMQQGIRPFGVVPPQYKFFEKGITKGAHNAGMEYYKLMSDEQAENSHGHFGGQAPRARDELEVIAQTRIAAENAAKMARDQRFRCQLNPLGQHILSTLLDSSLLPCDASYKDQEYFFALLEKNGIKRKDIDVKAAKCCASVQPGSGDYALRTQQAQVAAKFISLWSPEGQKLAVQDLADSIYPTDPDRAKMLAQPNTPNMDTSSMTHAIYQNNAAQQGILLPGRGSDNLQEHLQAHATALKTEIMQGGRQVQATIPIFIKLIAEDLGRLAAVNPNLAKQISGSLRGLMGGANQAMQALQNQPEDAQRLAMDAQELALKKQNQNFKQASALRQQQQREAEASTNRNFMMDQAASMRQNNELTAAVKSVQMAKMLAEMQDGEEKGGNSEE